MCNSWCVTAIYKQHARRHYFSPVEGGRCLWAQKERLHQLQSEVLIFNGHAISTLVTDPTVYFYICATPGKISIITHITVLFFCTAILLNGATQTYCVGQRSSSGTPPPDHQLPYLTAQTLGAGWRNWSSDMPPSTTAVVFIFSSCTIKGNRINCSSVCVKAGP